MSCVKLNAYAKINLSLDVVGRLENGYHEIESLMQGVELHDVLQIYSKAIDNDSFPGEPYIHSECILEDGLRVHLFQNTAAVPADVSNLAIRAAAAMQAALEDAQASGNTAGFSAVSIVIDKRLPVAAGIAGGSGNAAAVMLGLNALADNPLSLEELQKLGESIGADIPFSLMMNAARNREQLAGLKGLEGAGVSAMTYGIGDIIVPCDSIRKAVIMMNPGVPVSTAEVYRAIDALPEELRVRRGLWANMMEEYTLCNVAEAAELKAEMDRNLHADKVLMSGSGPTVVAYYDDAELAENDYEGLKAWIKPGWRAWLSETGKE